ncbi:MAG: PstS family phosphate ABC transporter substrate-binding protein [Bacteroidales bacterium]
MSKRSVGLLVAVTLAGIVIWSCGPSPRYHKKRSLEGHITISGAFALYPMATLWAEEFRRLYPEVEIDITAGGSGKGITDVLSGMVDLAMVSRDISPEEEAKGAWKIGVVMDAVVPIVNSSNPFIDSLLSRGLTPEVLQQIFVKQTITRWNDIFGISENEMNINVYTRSDACGAAEMWAKFLHARQEMLAGVGVYGDPGITIAIKNDPLSLGYNNLIFAYDLKTKRPFAGITILPIDLNENGIIESKEDFYEHLDSLQHAIQQGRYPSPPARMLYFVSKGKPHSNAIKEFLKWVLTDGQHFVRASGYVPLPNKQRLAELSKVRLILKPLHRGKAKDTIDR